MKKNKFNLLNIINYLAVFAVFSEAITLPKFFTDTYPNFYNLKVYNLVLCIILILMASKLNEIKIKFRFPIIFLITVYTYISLTNIALNRVTSLNLFKQLIGISLHSLVFYMLLKLNNFEIKRLFIIYLRIAIFVAIIGIFQEILYLSKFKELLFVIEKNSTNWSLTSRDANTFLRINSIMPEPFSFCLAMMPACFVAFLSIFSKKYQFYSFRSSLIIIIVFLLSFSTVGYFGLILSLILIIFNQFKKKAILIKFAIIIFLLPFAIYFNSPEFKERMDSISNFFPGRFEIKNLNKTSYTLYMNYLVTKNVLKKNPFFGNGLGSHEISFRNFERNIKIPNPNEFEILNERDAGSLFLRLLSETGSLGLISFIYFIFKFSVRKKLENDDYFWAINNSIMVLFFMRLIHQGNYISEGFFFFFWLYYFSKNCKLINFEC
jgi:hypothetical protein